MENIVGSLPLFTTDDTVGTEKVEEVKPAAIEETPADEEKETLAELPAAEKPAETSSPEEEVGDDTEKQVQGILREREKLLKEVQELRKQRRELRKEETQEVITTVADNLEDLNTDDIKNIERVLKARGYVTKEESQKLHYESVKKDELNKFLDKYPEYKPENDPHDANWNAFQRELTFYKMPSNPRLISEVLERAHRNIASTSVVPATTAKRIATARKGAGGMQRTPSGKSLPSNLRRAYEDGGWSEEEIKELEAIL